MIMTTDKTAMEKIDEMMAALSDGQGNHCESHACEMRFQSAGILNGAWPMLERMKRQLKWADNMERGEYGENGERSDEKMRPHEALVMRRTIKAVISPLYKAFVESRDEPT